MHWGVSTLSGRPAGSAERLIASAQFVTKEAGIAGDVGLATGYVLTFSNGLVVYLSGDTGITADQDQVVRGHYHAKLVVMNIGAETTIVFALVFAACGTTTGAI